MKTSVATESLTRIQVMFCILLASVSVFAQTEILPEAKQDREAYAEMARAPEKARTRHNPLGDNPDAAAAGRKLFQIHCAECHGNVAKGTRKGPSLHVREVQHATPGTLFWILTNGVVRHGMPVWSKLPEPQRWEIVTYLESLTASNEEAVGNP